MKTIGDWFLPLWWTSYTVNGNQMLEFVTRLMPPEFLVLQECFFSHVIVIMPSSHIELMCLHIIIIYKKAFRIFLLFCCFRMGQICCWNFLQYACYVTGNEGMFPPFQCWSGVFCNGRPLHKNKLNITESHIDDDLFRHRCLWWWFLPLLLLLSCGFREYSLPTFSCLSIFVFSFSFLCYLLSSSN